MKGTVKWFDSKKGYGFITDSEGKDIFVHYTGIATDEGFKTLSEGQEVTYSLADGKKGKQAVDVIPA